MKKFIHKMNLSLSHHQLSYISLWIVVAIIGCNNKNSGGLDLSASQPGVSDDLSADVFTAIDSTQFNIQSDTPSSSTHSLTLDLSKQSIGNVDLVMTMHNSMLMADHLRKIEEGIPGFLDKIRAAISGTLNTTVLSCSIEGDTGCLHLAPSTIDYFVPLSMYSGHFGIHWMTNIIGGQTLTTYDTPTRTWVTIDRSQVFNNNYKKVFIDFTVDNDDQTLATKTATFQTHADAQFGKSNVTFLSVSPKRRNNSCEGTDFHPENIKLAKYYGGKRFPICEFKQGKHFTKIAEEIKYRSWATFDISSLGGADITNVSLSGNSYAYHVIDRVDPPLLFVNLPASTANGTTITVTTGG